MAGYSQPRVAVIGLGAQGLVAVKNLLEQGFNVTGFDQNPFIGGIWKYAADDPERLSALPTTVINVSRQRGCFTDFEFKPGTSSFPNSSEVWEYLSEYTTHYKLWDHLKLSTAVKSIQHNEGDTWSLTIEHKGELEVLLFDKLIMATGPNNTPIMPDIQNQDRFGGTISHAVSFKKAEPYKGKRVLVIGASNTAADTACSLVGVASKVYLSHRHGAIVLPRFLKNGTSMDHKMSYRASLIKDFLEQIAPRISQVFMDRMINKTTKEELGDLDPQWNLSPPPSIWHQVPTISDYLIGYLRDGKVESCAAPLRVDSATKLELQDGAEVEVDAIICCTGYSLDYSILGEHDPMIMPDGTIEKQTPRLFQNVFSLKFPHSLAFVGIALSFYPAFMLSDLSTMALAQLWSNKPGSPTLPSQHEMENWYAEHLMYVAHVRSLSPQGKYVKMTVRNQPWFKWATTVAGTNVESHMSYTSPQAWWFWLNDRGFCKELMDGVFSPHMFRVFESDRRKKWEGARETILRTNRDIRADVKKRQAAALKV